MTEPTAPPDDLTGARQPEPQAQLPWCCTGRGHVSECPLCPQYGTSLLEPCPGHEGSEENQTRVAEARLHAERRHPGYEYATTTGPRKQWDDPDRPPSDDRGDPDPSWQPNLDAGYPGAGWERFDYHEEAYWRRRKAPAEPAGGPRSGRETADGTRGPRGARDVPEAAHSGSGELAAHHRTLAAVARVHADAIRSLHHRSSSQLDDHTARLLHVLDDELARVLTQLAETADALQAQPGGGYDGPSVQECAQADRHYWTQKYAGEGS